METAPALNLVPSFARWRDLVWPREHGSWSLALEPLALGLLVAPSAAGACLASAAVAAFFARRPLRAAMAAEADPVRRRAAWQAVALLAAVAAVCFAGALVRSGAAWLVWLLPAAAAGAVFLYFDLRAAGREGGAEVAGAAAFASLPAAFAALAGWRAADAAALAAVALGRAVPTVLTVRAVLRAAKTGELGTRRPRRVGSESGKRIGRGEGAAAPALALVAAIVGAAIGFALVRAGLAPRAAAVVLTVLALRTAVLLVWPRPVMRTRTLGFVEATLGVLFVATLALAWRAA